MTSDTKHKVIKTLNVSITIQRKSSREGEETGETQVICQSELLIKIEIRLVENFVTIKSVKVVREPLY